MAESETSKTVTI